MQEILIIVPTRHRFKPLRRMLDSCIQEPGVSIIVVCDGDRETFERLDDVQAHNLQVLLSEEHIGAVACRNLASPMAEDGLLYATDDIIFQPEAIQKALRSFNYHFPDDDGVVGFRQLQEHHPCGIGLVGRKFLDRYPGRRLFYPGYWHFACQEIHWLASKFGRFHYEPDAVVDHQSPNQYRELLDQTHVEARLRRAEDHRLMERRKRSGGIWGDGEHD